MLQELFYNTCSLLVELYLTKKMVCERNAGRPNVELGVRAMLRKVLSRASSHAFMGANIRNII